MHQNSTRRKRSNSGDGRDGGPSASPVKRKLSGLESEVFFETKPSKVDELNAFIHQLLFPNLPEQYPFRKKLHIAKNTTRIGFIYDLSQDLCSILMCIVFIASTYYRSYEAAHLIYFLDISISGYVLVDVMLNMFLIGKPFLLDMRCIVDILSIFPTFFITFYSIVGGGILSIFYSQLISTLRLVRVIRIFKTLRFFHSMKRAILKLVVSFCCFIFICSGLFQFFENDVPQRHYHCQYINEETDWQPSCSDVMAARDMSSCDCELHRCDPLYDIIDPRGEPTHIRCQELDFNEAVYFVVITVTLVGYGSSVLTFYSKVVIVAMIIIALITIPPQLNDIERFMSARTSYKDPYSPSAGDYHVIVCGHVNDKRKLGAFLKEFLHPDRMFSSSPQFHVVIMSTSEPSDGVQELLQSDFLEDRITYSIGSTLVQKDLERVRVDLAFGIFFLCNTEALIRDETIEDTATVMRALSVSNYNPSIECFVQVLKANDRNILKDSDVDVILCLDEYKTTLQAKNAICPGFSTLIENLFHSFGGVSSAVESELDPWYHEYLHGARMELYYVPLDRGFMEHINFNFSILSEAVFSEWNLIVMGVCTEMQNEISFNPISKKIEKSTRFQSLDEFYEYFNTAIVIADDNLQADEISKGLMDPSRYKKILKRMRIEEINRPIRKGNHKNEDILPMKRAKRSSFVTSFSRAKKSFSKQTSRLSDIVRSSPKNKQSADDILKRICSEEYDSDASVDEKNYIGFASTRDKEVRAVRESQNKAGFTDEGDKGFGRTSMVYTRLHSGLDVYKDDNSSDAPNSNPADGKVSLKAAMAMEKKKAARPQHTMMNKLASQARERGRKLSMAIRGRGAAKPSFKPMSPTAHEVVSNVQTGEVRKTFTLTPSQIAAQSYDSYDDDESCADDKSRTGSGNDSHYDSRLSTLSEDSVQKKRLGTFRIEEGDESEEDTEERVSAGKVESDAPGQNTGDNSSRKKWESIRNVVVPSSKPSQLAKVEEDTEENEDEDEDEDEDEGGDRCSRVTNVCHTGKKFTNVRISALVGRNSQDQSSEGSDEDVDEDDDDGDKDDDANDDAANRPQSQVAEKSDEDEGVKKTSRAPRRSLLRKNISKDNTVTMEMNSASVAEASSPQSRADGERSTQFPATFNRKKLPPLSTQDFRLGHKTGGELRPKATTKQAVAGPSVNLIGANPKKKKKKFFMKKIAMLKRRNRIAVAREPGEAGPKVDSVMTEVKKSKSSDSNDTKGKVKAVTDNASSETSEDKSLKKNVSDSLSTFSFSSVVKQAVLNNHPESMNGYFGRPAEIISDATFLTNHIVIFGNISTSPIFISELRRPTVRGVSYHPIVLIGNDKPNKWEKIVLQFNDVYFLPGSLLRSRVFSKSNIDKAFAVILLNMRNDSAANENVDSQTLFSYLKLEQYIPRHVFFSVELSNPANMSVLNATLMRRVRTQGTLDTRVSLRSYLESLREGTQILGQSDTTSNHQQSLNRISPSTPTRPDKESESVAKHDKPADKPRMSVARAVSLSHLSKLSSGSSSEEDDDDEGNDDDMDQTRKENIAKFRAQLAAKVRDDLNVGEFSSKRKTNRQSLRSPDSIPKAAMGNIGRVAVRGTIVQSRTTFSNFRPPTKDDFSGSCSGESSDEEKPQPKDEPRKEIINNDNDFWNATDTHHMLPVFAAARAYVPASFESLLVQSFFGVLTPMMCEIFVCGQSGQSVVQIDVPEKMYGRTFIDLFRVFSYHQVICIGLYRAPREDTMSCLPYVYLSPLKGAKLYPQDRVYLYGKPTRIKRAVATCQNNTWS